MKVGDIVKLINHISNGYNSYGDYAVLFPPPTYVKIVEIDKSKVYGYGVKVLKETELPDNLKGTQFRAILANSKVEYIGDDRPVFLHGDDDIGQEHFDKVYWQPEYYLKEINNNI
jgi:hypothetical protein